MLPHNRIDAFYNEATKKSFLFGKIGEIVPLNEGQSFDFMNDGVELDDFCFYKFLESKTAEIKVRNDESDIKRIIFKKKYFFEVYLINKNESVTLKFKFSSKTPDKIFIYIYDLTEPLFVSEVLEKNFVLKNEFNEYVLRKGQLSENGRCALVPLGSDPNVTLPLKDFENEFQPIQSFLMECYSSKKDKVLEEITSESEKRQFLLFLSKNE